MTREQRARSDARAKLAAALHLLTGDTEETLERALALSVEAGKAEMAVRDYGVAPSRMEREILDEARASISKAEGRK